MATQRQLMGSWARHQQSYNKCLGEVWKRHVSPEQNNQKRKLINLGGFPKPPSIFLGCEDRQT